MEYNPKYIYIVKLQDFRSHSKVNKTDDMIRLTIDMKKNTYHRLLNACRHEGLEFITPAQGKEGE